MKKGYRPNGRRPSSDTVQPVYIKGVFYASDIEFGLESRGKNPYFIRIK